MTSSRMPIKNNNRTRLLSAAKKNKSPNIVTWLKRETPHRQRALIEASRHLNRNDRMNVHTLEGIYAQESSFGQKRGKRYSSRAAGDFQIQKRTAEEMGLEVNQQKEMDQRFEVGPASNAAVRILNRSDDRFKKETNLGIKAKILSIPIKDVDERKKFVLAAYNAGDARIAMAQQLTRKAGGDPTKWDDVKMYLGKASADADQADETRKYVDQILNHEKEFNEHSPIKGHWITKDGRHIFIIDK